MSPELADVGSAGGDDYAGLMQEAVVEVLAATRVDDVATIRVRLKSVDLPSDPLAPAGLYSGEHGDIEVAQLHKFISREADGTLEFEAYSKTAPLPEEGAQLVLRAWWLPSAWDAVADRSRVWKLQTFTEGDHDHCLLTWETIYPGDDAYRSDAGEWMSVEAYERFVRDDILRVHS
jgi:hypothetical protein